MTDQPAIPIERVQLSHAKRLRGNPYRIALELKRKQDGNKNQCGHEGTQTLDHIEPRIFFCYCGQLHQDHSLENLRIICFNCNSAKGGPKPSNDKAKERESTGSINRRELLTQSEKHEKQRALWNEWIPELFAGFCASANRKLGIPEGSTISRISVEDLADLAVSELAIRAKENSQTYGSAQTYKKYIFEDRFTTLYLDKVEGVIYASFRNPSERREGMGTFVIIGEKQS